MLLTSYLSGEGLLFEIWDELEVVRVLSGFDRQAPLRTLTLP